MDAEVEVRSRWAGDGCAEVVVEWVKQVPGSNSKERRMKSYAYHIGALLKCIFLSTVAVLAILSSEQSVAEPLAVSFIVPRPSLESQWLKRIACTPSQIQKCKNQLDECKLRTPEKAATDCG
jgi:hypothetical protein